MDDLENINPIEHMVTPVAPYFFCDHFISTERHNHSHKYIDLQLQLKANDLIENRNYNDIKDFDIIQVQVDLFDFFYDTVLPVIITNNRKIVIITSQWHLPQLHRNHKTDELLKIHNIILWISQNPIYTDHYKYMAFPYGICHHSINDYVNFIKSTNINTAKSVHVLNQCATVYHHLPTNHIRRVFDIFGKNSGSLVNYTEFLTNILNSEFVISTSGDRDDCYRHYECIGLNAIPISNINRGYEAIFGDNMVYSNAEQMIHMIHTNIVDFNYTKPNRDILTISYWVGKIRQTIDFCKMRYIE